MQIEIKEKGSAAFYQETVNVLSQYRALIKKPERKLKDRFKTFRSQLILSIVLLVLLALMAIFWGGDGLMWGVMILLAFNIFLCSAYLLSMNKMRKSFMQDERSSLLTLDEEGVELNKEGAQVLRMSWQNLAFVRVFREALCFVGREPSAFVISVERRHEDAILAYLKEKAIDVPLIGK